MQKNKILIVLAVLIIVAVTWYILLPLRQNKVVDDTLPQSANEVKPSEDMSQLMGSKESGQNESGAPIISGPFPIVDTVTHPASGVVRIVRSADETILRYENYKTINGPDVRIYLAKDLDAKEYVDLGPIKGTEGNINYTVPKEIDISQYRYALTWCEDFSVLFNSADLSIPQ